MRKTGKAKVDAAKAKIDWSALDAMTEEERHAAAMADPTRGPYRGGHRNGSRATGPRPHPAPRPQLSQEEFAARYRIPVGTLRDWEQRRKEPDAAAKAYLHVIASEPEMVRKALARRQRRTQQGEAA
jgi:putative transcriptional regulator